MPDRLAGPSVLALVADARSGPALWRILQPFAHLERQHGYPAHWAHKDHLAIGDLAPRYQALVLPRLSWEPGHEGIASAWFAMVRRAGITTIYEADDDLFSPHAAAHIAATKWEDGKSAERLEAERQARIWALQHCDGATVSTQRLATIVRQYTDKSVCVVPNAIDLRWFRAVVAATPRTVPGLTIGWAGGKRPDRDVASMAEAWGRIARRFPDVTFVVQGHQPSVIRQHVPAERLVSLPWLPLEQYPAGLRQIDVGCCVVTDSPFNRAKSTIKAMEYAAAGATVVASPTLYRQIVVDEHSGFLCETVDEWETALVRLVEDRWLRQRMQRRLLKRVEREHSLALAWRWVAAWSEIVSEAQRRAA